MSISVVGSVGLDTIETPFGKVKNTLGGSASYFSFSAALFSQVNLIGTIGQDFPEKFIRLFKKKNIDLSGLEKTNQKTFSWKGNYDRSMSDPKTLAVEIGGYDKFDPLINFKHKKSKFLFLANIDPVLQLNTLEKIKGSRQQFVAADTMNFWISSKRKELIKLLKLVDLFFINESEAQQLTGEFNIIRIVRDLSKLGPKKIIIKKGCYGASLAMENGIFSLPACLVENAPDPTGAGDTFAGGVMGYLLASKTRSKQVFKKALAYGIVAATYAVAGFGLSKLKAATRTELDKKTRNFIRSLAL